MFEYPINKQRHKAESKVSFDCPVGTMIHGSGFHLIFQYSECFFYFPTGVADFEQFGNCVMPIAEPVGVFFEVCANGVESVVSFFVNHSFIIDATACVESGNFSVAGTHIFDYVAAKVFR